MNNPADFLTDKTSGLTFMKFFLNLHLLLMTALCFPLTADIKADIYGDDISSHGKNSAERSVLVSKINQYIFHHYYKPKAAGVIVGFHQWPDSDTEQQLIEFLRKEDLRRTKSIQLNEADWKLWIMQWPDLRLAKIGAEICQKLPQISELKHCEPDGQSPPPIDVINPSRIILPEELKDVISVCQSPVFGSVPQVKEACDIYSESHNVVLTEEGSPLPNAMPVENPERLLELFKEGEQDGK